MTQEQIVKLAEAIADAIFIPPEFLGDKATEVRQVMADGSNGGAWCEATLAIRIATIVNDFLSEEELAKTRAMIIDTALDPLAFIEVE
jgi:hypothetical protein